MSQIKERPILFSAPMVQAILEGKKTQTRRTIKPAPPAWITRFGYTTFTPEGHISGRGSYEVEPGTTRYAEKFFKCPYGKVGDRLWVRENWFVNEIYNDLSPVQIEYKRTNCSVQEFYGYTATEDKGEAGGKTRPSLFMPRAASRILLEVTGIKVEQLQCISEYDALKEGIRGVTKDTNMIKYCVYDEGDASSTPWSVMPYTSVEAFAKLWVKINGPASWLLNPWVWVVEFKRILP